MNIKRLLATAAMTAGLAIGLAATATTAPIGEIGDKAGFDECVKEHPDDPSSFAFVLYGDPALQLPTPDQLATNAFG